MGAPQASGPQWINVAKKAIFRGGAIGSRWMFHANSALYVFQIQPNAPHIFGSSVYKSTDGGNTWVEKDASNAPTAAPGTVCLDTVGNRLIVAAATETFPATTQPLFLTQFSLATDTWGANIATGGPNAGDDGLNSVFLRPDGTIAVIYDFGSGNPGGTSRLRAAIWNGATWSASIDVGASFIPFQADGNILVSGCACTMDATLGTIHLAYFNSAKTIFMYQEFKETNVLGQSMEWTKAGLTLSDSFGSICLTSNSILIPYASNAFVNNAVLIGTPLNALVWTVVTPAAMAHPGGLIGLSGAIQTDGTTLWWENNFATDGTFNNTAFQLFTSTDGGNTWAVVPDNATAPYFYDSAISPTAANSDFTAGVNDPTFVLLTFGGGSTAYVFGAVQNTVAGTHLAYYNNSEFFPAGAPLAIADTPPAGQVGVPYVACFPASGGTPPYTFSVTGGTIPPGLTLNPSSGCLTGVPSKPGTFTFTITVTDSLAATASVTATIGIGSVSFNVGGANGMAAAMRPCRTNQLDLRKVEDFLAKGRALLETPRGRSRFCNVPKWWR